MAPTKPLVAQQVQACYQIMGFPREDVCEITGSKPPATRRKLWEGKRIFFLTPQVSRRYFLFMQEHAFPIFPAFSWDVRCNK